MRVAEQDGVPYRLEVVGGPWDGVGGFSWFDDGEHPPPAEIFVGVCPGDGSCASPGCRPGKRHPAFWTDEEAEDTPRSTVKYEKQDEYVKRVEYASRDVFEGVAVYVRGGLDVLAVGAGAVSVEVPA